MKDLGEQLGINADYNQKIVKDSTKPMEYGNDKSPKEAASEAKKQSKELKGKKKPYPKKRKFKKISKSINVEKIPGSN